ncbi:hypothetical protein [Paludibaculum fermentans]|uniref:hypothetical protein n=1 Tax=Paludibaculum fermentans TaxID=1473598 RepID=UPI003EBDADF9
MNWLLTILIGLITAAACGAAACYLGTLCVEWYSISSFEGGSGYFVAFLTLFGIVIGLILGIVTSRVVAGGTSPGFLRAQGISLAEVAILFCVIALFCRLGGTIAPTIDGEQLDLEVELKCPRGMVPTERPDRNYLSCTLTPLGSGNKRLDSKGGVILWKQASESGGQWTVPCRVWLFSDSSMRTVRMLMNTSTDIEFMLPLPGKPGKEHFEWSTWRSDRFLEEKDKPIRDYSYRFRVRRVSEARSEAQQAAQAEHEKKMQAFAALTPDSPLDLWVGFGVDDTTDKHRIARVLVDRIAELPALLRSSDPEHLRGLTIVLSTVQTLPPSAAEALRQSAGVLAERLRAIPSPVKDEDNNLVGQLRGVYWTWHQLAGFVQDHKMTDFHDSMMALQSVVEARSNDSYEFAALADTLRTDLQVQHQ